MLLFSKFVILFLNLILIISCSHNSELNLTKSTSDSLSAIYIKNNNNRSHQILRMELEKSFNYFNQDVGVTEKKKKYILDIDIKDSISGNILSTSLNTMSINIKISLIDIQKNKEVFSDNFEIISSFATVVSLYGREQAKKSTLKKLLLSSSSEIIFRLRHYFNSKNLLNEINKNSS